MTEQKLIEMGAECTPRCKLCSVYELVSELFELSNGKSNMAMKYMRRAETHSIDQDYSTRTTRPEG